ncbi:replication restart helicase PriA [Chryseobacterium sp. A321]
MEFVKVILPLNLPGTFTYRIPAVLSGLVRPGQRVLVPFGGKKIYTAIVHEVDVESPELAVVKEVISLLDDHPILPAEQLAFWDFLSSYYLSNLGEIYRFAFPGSLKLESETYVKLTPEVKIDFENLDSNEMYLIQALEVRQLINFSEIEAFIPKKEIVRTIHSLIELRYIEIDERIAEKYKAKEVLYVKLDPLYLQGEKFTQTLVELKRSKKQQALFLTLAEKQTEAPEGLIRKSELMQSQEFGQVQLKGLIDKGIVQQYLLEKDRIERFEGDLEQMESLSLEQARALDAIENAFSKGSNVLLHGVTGSGKTHLYMERIAQTLEKGKFALYLLPEISLTKQIIHRLEVKFGSALGYYHSKLSDFEKVEVWKRVSDGTIQLLIGTRASLFLPFESLGLIIVDEEHDQAYRPKGVQPYFSAREASLKLGQIYGANVLLGSATPSVESFYLTRTEKLELVTLKERYKDVEMPKYKLLDYKEAMDSKAVSGDFAENTLLEMSQTLEASDQILVLHNRRGYAKVLECESCGHVSYCSNCDVIMTYHKFSNELKCHYCGHKTAKPKSCPRCQSPKLNTKGVGVEQLYEQIVKLFPQYQVERMDVDSMRRKFAYEQLYERIENRETDIVVGTQMISKGLDFDHIELVVIPRADHLLYTQDYRAEERAYQLITQIAGRAGRVSGKGLVLIQTFNPEHVVFDLIEQQDTQELYDHFLNERRKFQYPPFVKTVFIELKHRKEDKVGRAAQFLGSILRKYLPLDCVLGPEKSPIAKVNLLYQHQLLLKLPRGAKYHTYKDLIRKSLEEFDEVSGYKSIKKEIIVDF